MAKHYELVIFTAGLQDVFSNYPNSFLIYPSVRRLGPGPIRCEAPDQVPDLPPPLRPEGERVHQGLIDARAEPESHDHRR